MTAGREVILEFQRLGNTVKVTATDSETLVEVSIQGPAHASEAELRRTAIDKLNYVLRKRAEGTPRRGRP
jgi:hypothetical protein